VSFKAIVCTVPSKSTNRRLAIVTYIWKGGGGCHGCPCDCSDGRRDLQFAVWGTTEWFNNEYAPQLETKIRNATMTKIVPDHPKCVGSNPIVTVDVNKVSLTELISRFQCKEGKLIPLLDALNLNSISILDRTCNNCIKVDFSKSSSGQTLTNGMEASRKWFSYGLAIRGSTQSSRILIPSVRIFDTGNITCIKKTATYEYGSPNQACPGGGIGLGVGGSRGKNGENCKPLGSKYTIS
jgi:hypothetical protein